MDWSIMLRVVFGLLGVVALGLGAVAVFTARETNGSMVMHFGENNIEATHVGIFALVGLLFLGEAILGIGLHSTGQPSPRPTSSIPKVPKVPSDAPEPEPDSPSITDSRSDIPVPTGSAEPTEPPSPQVRADAPWIGEDTGLRAVIEKVGTQSGRVLVTVRLENDTGMNVSLPLDGFVAVDQNQHSYGAKNPRSSLVFDDVEDFVGIDDDFPDGTTRRGTVQFDTPLDPGTKNLQVRFTFTYEDEDVCCDYQHFTVAVDGVSPAR